MKRMKLNGAAILIECLIEQEVGTVFGFPGGAVLPIYDELFSPLLSSRSFTVSGLTFKSLIYIKLIFVKVQFHSFPCRYTVVSILFC